MKIKFKGKRLDNNEWVFGFVFIDVDGNHFIQPRVGGRFQVYVFSVGQFTSLKVKNGVNIYGGDILYNDKLRKTSFYVKYNLCGYDAVYDGNFTLNLYQVLTHEKGGCEIIGNIHDKK